MECYFKILEQVSERFDKGIYSLDRYRKVSTRTSYRGGAFKNEPEEQQPAPKRNRGSRKPSANILRMVNQVEHMKKITNEDLVNSDEDTNNVNNGGNLFNQIRDSMMRDQNNNNMRNSAGEDNDDDNNYSIYD